MRNLLLVTLLLAACGGPEDEGWSFGDEPIVIWTIPRPGEEPTTTPGPDSTPSNEEPVALGTPELGERPIVASVSPVACDGEHRSVVAPGTLRGALRRGRGELQEMPCASASGAEQRYRIEVPRQMGVEIWMSYEETSFSPVLLLQAGCGDGTVDLHCSSPIGSHPESKSAHIRADLAPGIYTLVVDERSSFDYGDGGEFLLHVDEIELDYNATCDAPGRLYPDNTGEVLTPDRGTTGELGSCFVGGDSRNYWRVAVSPRQGVRLVAEYEGMQPNEQGPHIQVSRGCYESCDGAANYGSVSIANDSDEVVDFVVSVNAHNSRPYSVFISETALLQSNASCDLPEVLVPGQPVHADLIAGSAEQSFCGGDGARQLFYSVEVPPGHRLLPEVAGATYGLIGACGAEQCLTSTINSSAQSRLETLAVGTWWGGAEQFSVTAHVVPVASNASCATAESLTIGASPSRGYLYGGGDERGACGLVLSEGFTLWYSVVVPAGSAVRVEAAPDVRFGAIGLEVMDGACGGECLGSHDPYLRGPGLAAVELENTLGSPKTYLIAATGERGVEDQGFEIRAIGQ